MDMKAKPYNAKEDMQQDGDENLGDPMNRECALCGKEETPPDVTDPVILSVYSTDLKKYLCSCCYNSMKELEDYADPKVELIEIL